MSEQRGLRAAIERRSAVPLVYVHHLPRWVLPLAMVGLLAIGMLGTGLLGGVALVLLAAVIGWLGYLSWPSDDLPGRLLRVAMLVFLLTFAAGPLAGQF